MKMQIDTKLKSVRLDTTSVSIDELIILRDLFDNAMQDIATETFEVKKDMCYK